MTQSAAIKDERRITRRKHSPSNLHIYCPQLNISRLRPDNLSTRGAYLGIVPDHAYVGRRVQLVFSVSDKNTVRLIRVWAVVVHLTNDGIGFGFTHKYGPAKTRKRVRKSL